jgi:hypothetical protein
MGFLLKTNILLPRRDMTDLYVDSGAEVYPLVMKLRDNNFTYKIGIFDPISETNETIIAAPAPYMPIYKFPEYLVTVKAPFYFNSADIIDLVNLTGNYHPDVGVVWWADSSIYSAVRLDLVPGSTKHYFGFLAKNTDIIEADLNDF